MSEPRVCYKCQSIITFCQCDESITNPTEYMDWAYKRIKELESKVERLTSLGIEDIQDTIRQLEAQIPRWQSPDEIEDEWEGLCWIELNNLAVVMAYHENGRYSEKKGGDTAYEGAITKVMKLEKPLPPKICFRALKGDDKADINAGNYTTEGGE